MTARLRLPTWLVVVGLAFVAAAMPALAQARNPFGVGISEGGGAATGITGWLLAQQAWFEHQLSAAVRGVRTDGGTLRVLVGLSFVYGVLHAAGPGHGKAVLASYMVANERAYRRGLVLSVLSALLQGLVAVALVAVLALVLHATAQRMKDAAQFVEILSFAGIACLGAWLTWRKGRVFRAAWIATRRPATRSDAGFALFGASSGFAPAQPVFAFAGQGGATASTGRFLCVDGDTVHAAGACLCHSPDPARLGGAAFSWREAVVTVVAAGSRPCSGAILVLVFSLAQGVFAAGVAAVAAMAAGVAVTTTALASLAVGAKGLAQRLLRSGSRSGRLAMAGIELAAAFAVLAAGLGLLLGLGAIGGA